MQRRCKLALILRKSMRLQISSCSIRLKSYEIQKGVIFGSYQSIIFVCSFRYIINKGVTYFLER